MSHLNEIMYSRGLTAQDLARISGLTYQTIWRLLKNDGFEFAQKATQQKIAAVLGVTVRDIIYGKDAEKISEEEKAEVKKKIVEAEVIKATEHLLLVLRNYYPEPMHLHISIFTRDVDSKLEGDNCEGEPDYYSMRIATVEGTQIGETVIKKSARVYYASDREGNEKIIKTFPFTAK